jgi:hypothetical protein
VQQAVSSAHRPTLRDLVATWPRWARLTLQTVAAAVALVVLALVLIPEDDGVDVVRTEPVAFNFRHPPELRSVPPREGETLRLERSVRGTFIQSFAVAPLEVPAYEGDVGGVLAVYATGEIERLRRRYAQFELVEEGKTRVNEVAGYTIVFRARLGERRLYGRVVLLPDPSTEGVRRGVRLILESTPSAGVGRADDVGVRGLNKRPYRSFRFGTEKP